MPSDEIKRVVRALHAKKLEDPYFHSRVGEYHASRLNPNHCLNAKWHAFKRAIAEGRHPDLPLRARLLMEMGELVHTAIESLFDGEYQAEQIAILPILDFKIVCRADLVGKDEVIDIKTKWGQGKLPQKPEKDHLYQLNLYLYAFRKTKGRLWYISPVDGDDIFFEVKYDPQMTRDVFAYTAQLHFCLRNDIEPPHKPDCRCRDK